MNLDDEYERIIEVLWAVEEVALVTEELPADTLMPVQCEKAVFVLVDIEKSREATSSFVSDVMKKVAAALRQLLGEENVRKILLPARIP